MNLYEKIISIYPELKDAKQFTFSQEGIYLRNDGEGKGDYIKSWNHPTLKQPTQEQLDAAK